MEEQSAVTTSIASQSDSTQLPVSEQVVEAVADAKRVSALDVYPPLYDAVDPEALDALVASINSIGAGSGSRVEFSYSGYEVTVFGSGTVSVTEADHE